MDEQVQPSIYIQEDDGRTISFLYQFYPCVGCDKSRSIYTPATENSEKSPASGVDQKDKDGKEEGDLQGTTERNGNSALVESPWFRQVFIPGGTGILGSGGGHCVLTATRVKFVGPGIPVEELTGDRVGLLA